MDRSEARKRESGKKENQKCTNNIARQRRHDIQLPVLHEAVVPKVGRHLELAVAVIYAECEQAAADPPNPQKSQSLTQTRRARHPGTTYSSCRTCRTRPPSRGTRAASARPSCRARVERASASCPSMNTSTAKLGKSHSEEVDEENMKGE